MDVRDPAKRHVVGGVDTHKDLHVAAVVDERDRILGSQSFATTRQGYRQMPHGQTWVTPSLNAAPSAPVTVDPRAPSVKA